MVEGEGGEGGGGEGKSRQPEVKAAIRWAFFLFFFAPFACSPFFAPPANNS